MRAIFGLVVCVTLAALTIGLSSAGASTKFSYTAQVDDNPDLGASSTRRLPSTVRRAPTPCAPPRCIAARGAWKVAHRHRDTVAA
jgi:hypothetical protein